MIIIQCGYIYYLYLVDGRPLLRIFCPHPPQQVNANSKELTDVVG